MSMRFMMYDGFGGVNPNTIEWGLRQVPGWERDETLDKIAAFVLVDRKIQEMKDKHGS